MSQPPEYPGYPGDPQPGGYQPPPPGYGPPPQQPPGYGAPPPGGGAPPPGYGAPPPPPGYGPGAYPQSPGGGIQFSAGDAFNWAWNKFTKNAVALIVPMLIYGVGLAIIIGGAYFVLFAVLLGTGSAVSTTTSSTYGTYPDTSTATDSAGALAGLGFFGVLIGGALVGFFIFLAAFYIQGAFVSGALDIADGKPVDISTFLRPPRNFGSVILAALLIAAGTALGYLLCILPGIIFLFFSQYTIPYVIDRSLSPVNALKASLATVNKNLGSTLLAYLVTVAVGFVGNLACGVGGIVSIPVSLLILTYTFRRLSGGPIAPATV